MRSATPLQLARERAERLYPKSKGYRNVYVAGARARLAGRASTTCPYEAKAGTWSVAWRLAWIRGWQSADEGPGDDEK